MKCPECGKEMREGYLFCSKDGAFSFANEVPGVFENAKNADGFVKITDLKASHRTRVPASICEECRTVMLEVFERSCRFRPKKSPSRCVKTAWGLAIFARLRKVLQMLSY